VFAPRALLLILIIMYPHRIRLRGPWDCELAGQTRRVSVPFERPNWAASGAPLVLSRQFGYPGRIDARDRIWIIVGQLDAPATLALNGHSVGDFPVGSVEIDVTDLMKPHNRLEIRTAANFVGEVALEIRASAYLKEVRAHRAGDKLQVEGAVAGHCEETLELYLLIEGHQAAYQTVNAGETFNIVLAAQAKTVRVELVNVATVWYVLDVTVGG
jgi:hypothetical protein